jgi:preprotein translocase subunit SecE
MAAAEVERPSLPARLAGFYQDVVAEMRKVTWPDKTQIRQLSIGVVLLALFIGAIIALLDLALQGILIRALPALVGG